MFSYTFQQHFGCAQQRVEAGRRPDILHMICTTLTHLPNDVSASRCVFGSQLIQAQAKSVREKDENVLRTENGRTLSSFNKYRPILISFSLVSVSERRLSCTALAALLKQSGPVWSSLVALGKTEEAKSTINIKCISTINFNASALKKRSAPHCRAFLCKLCCLFCPD